MILIRRAISKQFDFDFPQSNQLIIEEVNRAAHQGNALADSIISTFDTPGSVWGSENHFCLLYHYGLEPGRFLDIGHGTQWNEIVSIT
jgi:hypothetical protein